MAEQIHQIPRVGLIQHRHDRGQTQHLRMRAHELMSDGVEHATPKLPCRAAVPAQRRGPRQHVRRGPPGERQQQDPRRIHPVRQQPRHPRRNVRVLPVPALATTTSGPPV
jgi:hypothetical protein